MSSEIHYGKSGVTAYRVGADGAVFAARVSVDVLGDNFLPAYTEGDNSNVVATDTMKNFVWATAAQYAGATQEGFAAFLAGRFIATWDQIGALRVRCEEIPLPREGRILRSIGRGDRAVAVVECSRESGVIDVRSGREGLELLKVTGSSFTHFVRDAYTTLPEIVDRPLSIGLDVHWRHSEVADALGESEAHVGADAARAFVCATFDEFNSRSIQHLVHEIGRRMLERFPSLAEVAFDAQNRTPDAAVPVKGDGMKVYTDARPIFGNIGLVLRRDARG